MKRRVLGFGLLAAIACGEEVVVAEEEVIATAEVIERPLIEFAGCAELEKGVCMLTAAERSVDVWIDVHSAAEIDVRVDAEAVEFERHAADGGLRIRVAVPSGVGVMEVRGVDPPWSEDWSLSVADLREPGVLLRARELTKEGKTAEAVALLEAVLDEAKPRDRVLLLDLLRRLLHARGHRAGALQRAIEQGDLAHGLELPHAEANACAAAAFAAQEDGDNEAARRFIARVRSRGELLPEARMRAAYQSSLVARKVDDVMLALRELTEAERVATRLGHSDMADISTMLATVLRDLGRGADARAAVRRSIEFAAGVSCGNRARLLNTAGFTYLVLAEQGLEHEPARPLFDVVLALVEPTGACPSPRLYADVRVNLALDALENAEPEEALEHLQLMENVPSHLEPWVSEIRARIGLDTGRWELLPSVVTRPDPAASVGLRWTSLERQARLLEQLGLVEAAVEAHIEAEDLLEEAANGIAMDVGQELFLAGRSASSRELVRVLVDAGRDEEALCRARLARGRSLRRLDRTARLSRAPTTVRERWSDAVSKFVSTRVRLRREADADWELSDAELRSAQLRRDEQLREARQVLTAAFEAMGSRIDAPDCGDLPSARTDEQVLLPFPLDDGWIVFAADQSDVTAFSIPEPDTVRVDSMDAIASRLHAAHLRVLPTGRAWSVPFHAIDTALDDMVVTYGLDLEPREDPRTTRRAVVVSDPSGDLPMARVEADAVERRLRDAGWAVASRGGRAATRSGIVDALADASLLHYAGHGVHRGETGWEAALVLPDRDELTVSDILALPAVPTEVVLTGCETGQASSATLGGGMNLGHAFLFAGANAVVVADAKVPDELARRVGESLYEDAARLDLPAALHRVQRRLRDEGARDWAAFRVITR